MHTSTHQIRLAALLTVGMLAAHLRASAQVQAFSFSDKGRLFYTSPSFYSSSGSSDRALAMAAEEGTSNFITPKPTFMGLTIGGQYFFHSIFLGYQVGVGASSKATNAPQGASYTYSSRDYNGDIIASLGLVALRIGQFRFIPSYGMGVGAWGTHLLYQAQPEGPNGQVMHDDKEGAIYTLHKVSDAGLQMIYTQPTASHGRTRFSIGLKLGYKQYGNTATAKNALGPIVGNYGPMGLQGYYTQLHLGLGMFRDK